MIFFKSIVSFLILPKASIHDWYITPCLSKKVFPLSIPLSWCVQPHSSKYTASPYIRKQIVVLRRTYMRAVIAFGELVWNNCSAMLHRRIQVRLSAFVYPSSYIRCSSILSCVDSFLFLFHLSLKFHKGKEPSCFFTFFQGNAVYFQTFFVVLHGFDQQGGKVVHHGRTDFGEHFTF